MSQKLNCTLILEIQKRATQKNLDELIECYQSIFTKIIVTNPYQTKLQTKFPMASVDSKLSIPNQRNSIANHLESKRVCYLTTDEKLFVNSIPQNMEEDAYYMQKIERINSQYAPDYILYKAYIYNPKKFQWVGKHFHFLQPLPKKHTLHIGKSQIRNLKGKQLETESTEQVLKELSDPSKLYATELYYILFRGLIFSTKLTIQKVVELLDSYDEFLFKNRLAGLFIIEKLYFKIVKDNPKKAREIYQKYLPKFKDLPQSYLLQATHKNLHGNSEEGEKLLQKYLHSLKSLQAKDFLDLYFSEEDRFSLPYLQSLQIKLTGKDFSQVVDAGNMYFSTINNFSKLKTVDRQIRKNTWLKLELPNYLPSLEINTNPKFVVISHPRSGSTLLTKLLNSHPNIHMLGEILNSIPRNTQPELRFPYYIERTLDPVSNIERQMNNPKQPNTTSIGSKLLFFQLEDKTIIENLIEKGYKIIYLMRHNLLDRYISSINARNNQTYFSNPNYKIEDKVEFQPNKFKNFIDSTLELNNEFNIKSDSIYHISYTDLVTKKDKKMNEIFNFLGLKEYTTSTKMRKQNTKEYSQSISNYETYKYEIEQYLNTL